MEETPLVTVLMASYDPRWDRLRRSVDSLIRQTWQRWELVLWDDGSSPRGGELLRQAAALDSRVRLYQGRENQGLGGALNQGLARGRGSLVARLDDDDFCHPQRLERQVAFLRGHPGFGWVGSWAVKVDQTGPWGMLTPPICPGPRDFLPHSPYVHPSVMFRRAVLERAGGYSASAKFFGCEDYQLFFRLYAQGERGANLPLPLLFYGEDRDSYRRRGWGRRLREAALRAWGYRQLGLSPLESLGGVLRPLGACLVPGKILYEARRHG